MAVIKRRPNNTVYYDLDDSEVARAAYYAIQSVNPMSAGLRELAEVAGIKVEKEKKEAV